MRKPSLPNSVIYITRSNQWPAGGGGVVWVIRVIADAGASSGMSHVMRIFSRALIWLLTSAGMFSSRLHKSLRKDPAPQGHRRALGAVLEQRVQLARPLIEERWMPPILLPTLRPFFWRQRLVRQARDEQLNLPRYPAEQPPRTAHHHCLYWHFPS
jgi:hypothetical protein